MIELKHISKIYGDEKNEVHALRDVSISVQEGEFITIIGHSGSGKSTLMHILGCLDVPTSGEYVLMGESAGSLSADERARLRSERIGFIFQGFHLSPRLSALENVELPLLFRGIAPKQRRAMAIQALERVGLQNRLHHRPSALSGGQQQRVAIARALASQPPIILADEPTGNLDRESGKTVLEMLQSLHAAGHTILLITHDMTVAALGTRTLTMTDGCLV